MYAGAPSRSASLERLLGSSGAPSRSAFPKRLHGLRRPSFHRGAPSENHCGAPSPSVFTERHPQAPPRQLPGAFYQSPSAFAKHPPGVPSWSAFPERLRGAPSRSAFAERLREAPSQSAFLRHRGASSWSAFLERLRGAPSRNALSGAPESAIAKRLTRSVIAARPHAAPLRGALFAFM